MVFPNSPPGYTSGAMVDRPMSLRPEIMAAYESSIREVHEEVTMSFHDSHGDSFQLGLHFTTKLDLTFSQMLSAIGREIRSTSDELSGRLVQK